MAKCDGLYVYIVLDKVVTDHIIDKVRAFIWIKVLDDICEGLRRILYANDRGLSILEVILWHETEDIVTKGSHVRWGPVTVTNKLIIMDGRICATVDEKGTCLRLHLILEHNDVGMIVIEAITSDL